MTSKTTKLDFSTQPPASPHMNGGAYWAKEHDRNNGVFPVIRDHTTLGIARRGNPDTAMVSAWESLELFESRFYEEQIVYSAMRLLE